MKTLETVLKEGNSTVNQQIKSDFISQHVNVNVNSMVNFTLRSEDYSNTPFTIDDVVNYYTYPHYNGTFAKYDGGNDDIDLEISRLELIQSELDEAHKDYDSDSDDLITEIHDLQNLETEPQEVLEWWSVSSFLCEKLEELGHPVIEDENIWGRCTSGQAILLDYAITQICADMGILEGQENSWA